VINQRRRTGEHDALFGLLLRKTGAEGRLQARTTFLDKRQWVLCFIREHASKENFLCIAKSKDTRSGPDGLRSVQDGSSLKDDRTVEAKKRVSSLNTAVPAA